LKVQDNKPHLGHIFSATRGIIFLGTPHRGSDKASLAKVVASIVGVVHNTNVNLLRDLERDSQTLDRIGDRFRPMLEKHPFSVWSFVEKLPTYGKEPVCELE
jgi:hypothetical protein